LVERKLLSPLAPPTKKYKTFHPYRNPLTPVVEWP
jgi:hypothetical protein